VNTCSPSRRRSVQNGIDFNNLTGMTNEPRQAGAEIVVRW
jgi:hypothetical protein